MQGRDYPRRQHQSATCVGSLLGRGDSRQGCLYARSTLGRVANILWSRLQRGTRVGLLISKVNFRQGREYFVETTR